jgi:hypothetical protein
MAASNRRFIRAGKGRRRPAYGSDVGTNFDHSTSVGVDTTIDIEFMEESPSRPPPPT